MTSFRTQWQRIRNYIWIVCGALCLFVALVFWAITDNDAVVEVEKSAETEAELQIQPEKVAATNLLGALEEEVRPLEMTTRTVATVGSYEPEFRGSKFINENKNSSTIELFRVTKDDIIQSFLKKQPNRQNFFYIRLQGENEIEQYVLLYGIYKHENAAKQALQTLDLQLPKSIQPQIQEMTHYLTLVNDMGAEEMAGNQKLYAIQLKAAALPRVDESLLSFPKPNIATQNPKNIEQKSATTSTTITRRDENGNVVDVQQSHSAVQAVPKKNTPNDVNPKPVEREINDPFN